MLTKLLKQIEEQCEGKTYKIVVVDDHSTDHRYNNLSFDFNNVKHIRNSKNQGIKNFNITISKLLKESEQINYDVSVFLADDLQLSENFIKYLDASFHEHNLKALNLFLFKKEIYTNWGCVDWVDGAFAIKKEYFDLVNYTLPNPNKNNTLESSGLWRIFTARLEVLEIDVYMPKHSLVKHLGHTLSVMHPEQRKTNPIDVFSFIDDYPKDKIYRKQLTRPQKRGKSKFNLTTKKNVKQQVLNREVEHIKNSKPTSLKNRKKLDKEAARKRMIEYKRYKNKNKKKRVRGNNSKKKVKPKPKKSTKDHTSGLFSEEHQNLIKQQESKKHKPKPKNKNKKVNKEIQKTKQKKKFNVNLRSRR
jgi:hypothetical protein